MVKLSSALLALAMLLAAAAPPPAVNYPAGFRSWRHVKSMVLHPGHALYDAFGGLHHIYANPKAVAGYQTGKFPDGAVIVFDLVEAPTAGNATTEGPRKVVGVMVKNSARYPETGGWGFEGFKGDSQTERAVGANAKTACFACHLGQKDTDYVFSKLRN